ncbi:MAG: hypothetical protein EBS68_00235 [Rhodobacteraceae bacterium]|nr:hypothetical protein [Paracoccaceae bacterium]
MFVIAWCGFDIQISDGFCGQASEPLQRIPKNASLEAALVGKLDMSVVCPTCAQPCTTACPIGALTPAGYDVPRCRAYIATPEGAPCLTQGCAVRRACPVSAGRRLPEQSAWHMEQFK